MVDPKTERQKVEQRRAMKTKLNHLAAIFLLCALLTDCATIRRHPKATAIIVGAAIAIPVGIKLGYQRPCPSLVSGYSYNGTAPCPKSCDGLGDCYWPKK